MDTLSFSAQDVIKIIGLLLTGAGTLFVVVKWLISQFEKALAQEQANRERALEALKKTISRAHERLDDLPDVYARRQDVMDHLARIEASQAQMREEFNSRLDRMIQILSTSKAA